MGIRLAWLRARWRELYDEGFLAKRMELGAVIGAVPVNTCCGKIRSRAMLLSWWAEGPAVTAAAALQAPSKEHTTESLLTSGAEVQKGDPPTERKLLRLFRNPAASVLIKKCNDFGAGGVSVAIRRADRRIGDQSGCRAQKYQGLDGTELAISESQERMAVVVSPEECGALLPPGRGRKPGGYRCSPGYLGAEAADVLGEARPL